MILGQFLMGCVGFLVFVLFDTYNDHKCKKMMYQHKLVQETFKSKLISNEFEDWGYEGMVTELLFTDGHSNRVHIKLPMETAVSFLKLREDIAQVNYLYSYTGGDIHEFWDGFDVKSNTWTSDTWK